jgi:hypothetical protein
MEQDQLLIQDQGVVDASVEQLDLSAGTSAGVEMQDELCDESKPETCVCEQCACEQCACEQCACEQTEENSCEQQEVSSSVKQQSKNEDDSCNQIGMTSPLMFAVFAAFLMKRFSRLFN